ncbi:MULTISPECIES: tetratricopeptide repeat protein [unclassified Bradyrhizobium]|uniref:tetratricopeptide repeat protein n=1 Tax=unclassified Bradyrhizobium TaxID=2631580 RepID=UPI0027D4D9A5|nr:tetratricopeptide repeat protein [Bradyrhizobium sp. TM233]GMO94384.1 tetratricopeptide repeat protein [Bradyrhizobium sp. TM239]
MAARFPLARTLCLAFVLGTAGVAPALAQQVDPPGKQKKLPEAPAKLPKVDRNKNLEFLFGALKAAPDEASAKHVEARIWAIWLQTPSDTAALLMARAKTAVDAKKIEVAIKLLDSVIKLRPDYIEAWNRRATLYYMQNDYGRSLADIQQVLIREPRHFGALAGLGMIMQEVGDEKRALEAYRKALAVNPHLEKIPDQVKSLTEKVEGRDI